MTVTVKQWKDKEVLGVINLLQAKAQNSIFGLKEIGWRTQFPFHKHFYSESYKEAYGEYLVSMFTWVYCSTLKTKVDLWSYPTYCQRTSDNDRQTVYKKNGAKFLPSFLFHRQDALNSGPVSVPSGGTFQIPAILTSHWTQHRKVRGGIQYPQFTSIQIRQM